MERHGEQPGGVEGDEQGKRVMGRRGGRWAGAGGDGEG